MTSSFLEMCVLIVNNVIIQGRGLFRFFTTVLYCSFTILHSHLILTYMHVIFEFVFMPLNWKKWNYVRRRKVKLMEAVRYAGFQWKLSDFWNTVITLLFVPNNKNDTHWLINAQILLLKQTRITSINKFIPFILQAD